MERNQWYTKASQAAPLVHHRGRLSMIEDRAASRSINMHGKRGFTLPKSHLARRVRIVLGKKKTDKHTVRAPGEEAAQHPICRSLRTAYVRCYMEYVPRDDGIFCGGYYRREEGLLVRECRDVTPSRLFRESIRSLASFPPKHVG